MLREYLKSIADAIRSKLGITDKVNAQDFADKVNEVYDKGRTDEWSDFWDVFQVNGKRSNYDYAFQTSTGNASAWTDEIFNPKYVMNPSGLSRTFQNAKITDLKNKLGSTANCNNFAYAFRDTKLVNIPTLDVRKATNSGTLNGVFYGDTELETIEKIILNDTGNQVLGANSFYNCKKLREVRFEGINGQTIGFQYSPLSVDSMKSFILTMKNYKGTSNEFAYTVTFTDACWEALEADSTAPDGSTWREYVQITLGWNI